jgi:hypothetical protein
MPILRNPQLHTPRVLTVGAKNSGEKYSYQTRLHGVAPPGIMLFGADIS